jgi:tRNA (cmo5U34)-methyltransferase
MSRASANGGQSPAFAIPVNWTFRDAGVASGFDRHVREQLPWYDHATGAVAHVARHYLPQGGTVYDLGAATGNIGRALAPALEARGATLISVEASPEMAALYAGPQPENLVVAPAEEFALDYFDVAIAFLTVMFIPLGSRRALLQKLVRYARPGGAVIVFDKCEAVRGYAATVLWRLALAGKVAAGVEPAEIVAKELSLSGVQRPFDPALLDHLGKPAIEFFRFGEFAGWLIET